ncbi:hypothetical protein BDV93DRAFT_525021 [Ceratobasidium sp. AG-I]|nr:hypothetical protein BDV93DRAFT_525021 [Ceratobasidium sp. AG-I]
MAEPHPLWGRSLDQYAAFYGHNSSRRGLPSNLIPDHLSRIKGQEAMAKMCQGGEVTLDMLRSVLQLALSPSTLRDFNNPFLIHICLKLISQVKSLSKLPVGFMSFLG